MRPNKPRPRVNGNGLHLKAMFSSGMLINIQQTKHAKIKKIKRPFLAIKKSGLLPRSPITCYNGFRLSKIKTPDLPNEMRVIHKLC